MAARTGLRLLALGGVAALLSCGSPDEGNATRLAGAGVATTTRTAAQTAPTTAPAVTPESTPSPSYRTVTVTRPMPFPTTTVKDSSLPDGVRKVRTRGVAGLERLTYTVTLVDGVQTDRLLVGRVTLKAPVRQVTVIGTKVVTTQACDPNYRGACVPIASDVDCAGGSGNGPAYVQGPVRVIGVDIYHLDSDGDRIGCE